MRAKVTVNHITRKRTQPLLTTSRLTGTHVVRKSQLYSRQAGATTVDATRFRARHVTPLSAMSMSAYDKLCYSRTLNTYLFNFLPLLTQLRKRFLGILAAYKWKALTAYLNECSLLQMCTAAYGWILI